MTIDDIMYLGQRSMMVTLMVASPMLVTGMVIGLLISLLQSVTQIQEITLTFVPKIICVLLAFVLFLPWMASTLLGFVRELFTTFPRLIG